MQVLYEIINPMMQIINPSKNPDYPKVQGRATIPDPIIVFQQVKIVVIELYLFSNFTDNALNGCGI